MPSLIKNGIIHNNVSISNAIIGTQLVKLNLVHLLGSSAGFGLEEKTKKKINHIGNVIIKNNSTIGSNVTIDRAVLDSTIIGEYSQIDHLVQIAHKCYYR